jgi:carboxymethylenebutenolidase
MTTTNASSVLSELNEFYKPPTGRGPGVVLAVADPAEAASFAAELAADGYLVLCLGSGSFASAVRQLRDHPDLVGQITAIADRAHGSAAFAAAGMGELAALVLMESLPEGQQGSKCPIVVHLREGSTKDIDPSIETKTFYYDDAPGHPLWRGPNAPLVYGRTLALLRRQVGPHYDLEALWEHHLACEFTLKDPDANMRTMVAEPYVNHVPTMTGGVGHDLLKRFYTYHFIGKSPRDRYTIPISRTVGANRIVEEKVFCFTHDAPLDWLLPGVAPTGKRVEIPLVAIITFSGDKLCNEHIYWDQASVLAQIGLLDPTGLPVAGREQARKLVDRTLPSNVLMPNWAESEGKPI